MATNAAELNREFYERVPPGRRDYWRKMAACRHRVDTLVTALVDDQAQSIVDLGCGDGSLVDELRQAMPNCRCAGVDLSEGQIRINRRDQRTQWFVADLDGDFEIPELVGSADAVVASEVIEHLDNPDRFLRSARGLLGKRGRIYLSTQSGVVRETERRVGHRQHFSSTDMHRLLAANGWSSVRIWNTGYPFHDWSKWFANLSPDAALQQFGEKPYGFRENALCWMLRQAFRVNSTRRGAQLFAIAELM